MTMHVKQNPVHYKALKINNQIWLFLGLLIKYPFEYTLLILFDPFPDSFKTIDLNQMCILRYTNTEILGWVWYMYIDFQS